MRELDLEQGSPDWHTARNGVITGTKAQDLFDTLKSGKPAKSRENAIAVLAMERLDSAANIIARGQAMERGHEFEDAAAGEYGFWRNVETEVCGFALHDHVDLWGCSPDRLIGDDGVLEIKVPTAIHKHVKYLQDPQELLAEYGGQCLHNLFITGRDWIDICSYHPEARSPLHLAICRLERPASWDEYMGKLNAADAEIEALIDALNNKQSAA